MSITITQIAKLAGVSRGTVDRVIHQRGRVAPEVEKKILHSESVRERNFSIPNILKTNSIKSWHKNMIIKNTFQFLILLSKLIFINLPKNYKNNQILNYLYYFNNLFHPELLVRAQFQK